MKLVYGSHGFIVNINFCGFFKANSFKDIELHVSHLALLLSTLAETLNHKIWTG